MSRGFHFILILFAGVLLPLTPAHAEPIETGRLRITSGHLLITTDFGFDDREALEGLFLSGPGFFLSVFSQCVSFQCPPLFSPVPLRGPFDVSYTYPPISPFPPAGVRLERGSLFETSTADLQLRFVSPPQLLPTAPPPNESDFVEFDPFPFSMTGSISGRDVATGRLFRFDLEGQGRSQIRLFL
jgi:hypothetical protein